MTDVLHPGAEPRDRPAAPDGGLPLLAVPAQGAVAHLPLLPAQPPGEVAAHPLTCRRCRIDPASCPTAEGLVLEPPPAPTHPPSRVVRAVDRLTTSAWTGLPVFLVVVWALVAVTTAAATPLQDALAALLAGPVAAGAGAVLTAIGVGDTWFASLLVDGVLMGVGTVVTFAPLLVLVSAGLVALERCGYLPRAALAAGGLMRRLGLPGESMLLLVLGFGCNVPAISAASRLADERQRRVTILLVPLMTCSARMPVYVLVASAVVPGKAAFVVCGAYAVSLLAVLVVGLLLRPLTGRHPRRVASATLAPPPCALRWPDPRPVLAEAVRRLVDFVRGVAVVVTASVAVVWLLAALPLSGTGSFGDVALEDSALGRVSTAVAPVFEPAGLDHPSVSAALATGVVAKEAMIASFGTTTAVADGSGDVSTSQLQRVFADASGGEPVAAGLAFCVFVLAYMPCLPTFAAQRAVVGLRWAAGAAVVQTGLAWALAVGTFQLVRLVT